MEKETVNLNRFKVIITLDISFGTLNRPFHKFQGRLRARQTERLSVRLRSGNPAPSVHVVLNTHLGIVRLLAMEM